MPRSRFSPARRSFLVRSLGLATVAGGASLGIVHTAGAYGWSRTLQQGDSGPDVTELQVRVAGWAADSAVQTFVAVDGAFGPGTAAAVQRFQNAYGIGENGVVGPQTQSVLNSLESADGSTAHFAWSEFHSKDGSGFSGGNVDTSTVQANIRRLMYKLEALRKKAGDRPVNITSGFRSISHNNNTPGAAPNSQHTYGIAGDFTVSGLSIEQVRSLAQTCGFSGIITYNGLQINHVDNRAEYAYGASGFYWVYAE